jgi:hypothetical protein
MLNGIRNLLCRATLYGMYAFENWYEFGLYCEYSTNCSNYASSFAYCWLIFGCYSMNWGPSLPYWKLVYEEFWYYCFRFLRILFTDILSLSFSSNLLISHDYHLFKFYQFAWMFLKVLIEKENQKQKKIVDFCWNYCMKIHYGSYLSVLGFASNDVLSCMAHHLINRNLRFWRTLRSEITGCI